MTSRRFRLFTRILSIALMLILIGVIVTHIYTSRDVAPSSAEAAMQMPTPEPEPHQNPVDFVSEHIALEVLGDSVRVTGTYWFRVNDGRISRLPIRYPFPVDEIHAYPTFVSVVDGDNNPVEFIDEPEFDSVHFAMDLSQAPEFTVVYTQPITSSQARYILTTTTAWNKPLEHASFTFALPEEYTLASCSYAYEDMLSENGQCIYAFSKDNFMPEYDLIVSWTD